jgi:REP element-mobilizing transposase RayT
MRKKQLDFFNLTIPKSAFGGSHLKSHPKCARPISCKDLMHVVLKSEKAKGALSFARIEREIQQLARKLGLKLGVKINDIVVMSNHIHLSIRVMSRRAFKAFLRSLSALIIRKLCKGMVTGKNFFFNGRPFSRIIASGRRSYATINRYFDLNRLEKIGFSKTESLSLGLCVQKGVDSHAQYLSKCTLWPS